jgi:cytochrome P450/ABC-type polysaccharide/polyol phosphate transport system ATPase subunit
MTRTLLDVQQLSKRYSLRPQARLRDATADMYRELCGLPPREGLRDGEFWALENVDLRIDAGEVLGVIGHNGSGKSTLMNLVSGIIRPTTGSIAIHTDKVCRIDQGGVLSTQETGRENIRMQLAFYGVPVADTVAESEAIAAFADLHEQLDAPVGTYSTGMRSRLGFAIYARLHPDLFLVDEAIGGGDQGFRERFRGFITDYVAGGGSMLFAMHDTNMIQTLCDRVLVLDGGRAVLTADATTAIDAYNRIAADRGLPPLPIRRPRGMARLDLPAPVAAASEPSGPIVVDAIAVVGADGGQPRSGMPADVVITVRTTQPLDTVVAHVRVSRGEIAPLATLVGDVVAIAPPGITLRCRVSCLTLVPGEYDVRVSLYDRSSEQRLGSNEGSGRVVFRVEPSSGQRDDAGGRGGLLHLPSVWETVPLIDPVVDDAEDAFRLDPYRTYARWRAEPGPFYSPSHQAWIVSRHDQVSALFRDPLVTNRTEKAGVLGDTMLAYDPPDHGRLRSLVTDAFTGPAVRAIESRILAITDELIDEVAGLSRFDFVEHVADCLPGRVMTGLLGLPDADLPMLRACTDMTGGPEVSARNMRQLSEYFTEILRARHDRPGDDLVSSLLAAHDPEGRASMTEVLATCVLLLLAGYETTSSVLGNGMLLLLRHPDQYARLRENPQLVGPAVEEILRFESPTHFPSARAAKEPMEIGGQSIAAGDRILACLGAANRDPAVFPHADRFDIGRSPNRHLAFGLGIHRCPGALLSRTETRIALTRINERLGELHLDAADPRTFRPSWRRTERVRGLTSLPVRR